GGRVVLDIGSPQLAEHQALARRESLAESLRLLYVAATRGKHRTYLVWGAFKDAGNSALHYLLHPHADSARGQVALTDEAMLDELRRLAGSCQGAIEVLPMPAADREPFLPRKVDVSGFDFRRFSGNIPRDWRVASFTSLATRQHHAAELPDRDEGSRTEPGETAAGEPAGIFAFPRGAKA